MKAIKIFLLSVLTLLPWSNALAQDVVEIGTVEQLKSFRDAVNNGTSYAGKIVRLTADIDLSGEANWKPIGNLPAYPTIAFKGEFDGNGKTISNLTVSDATPDHATAGLFGSIETGSIHGLTVENVNITSSHYAGGIVAYTSNNPTIYDCHVKGGHIMSAPEWLTTKSEYDNGDKAGGIMGYCTAGTSITNCTVEGVTITGYRDLGGICGYAIGSVTNCTVSDVIINQNDKNAYKSADQFYTACPVVGGSSANQAETNTNGNATYQNTIVNTIVRKYSVAKIGETTYQTLTAAFAAAQAGDVVVLQNDYDATGESGYDGNRRIGIDKSITFDGDGHALTVRDNGIGVGAHATANIDVTFKDINITSGLRCIDTRGHIGTLTIEGSTLKTTATSGYTQPLTIGGNQSDVATVNITNSTIKTNDDATAYYDIITFNPVNMTISNSTLMGWACIYAKAPNGSAGSAGSVFTIKEGSKIISNNIYNGTSNAFAAFKIEDNNVTVNVENSEIFIQSNSDQHQAITSGAGASVNLMDGCTVSLTGGNAIYAFNSAKLAITGGKYNVDPTYFCAEGFKVIYDLKDNAYPYHVVAYTDKLALKAYDVIRSEEDLNVVGTDDNVTIVKDETDGYYYYTAIPKTVTITNEAGYKTFCLPFGVDFTSWSKIKAYVATAYADGEVTLKQVFKAAAGEGVVLKGEVGATENIVTTTGVTVTDGNLLIGVLADTFVAQTEDNKTNYVIGENDDVWAFYKVVEEGGTLAAGKSYLQLDGANAARINFVFENEATGINNLIPALSKGEGACYDLQGRKVAQPTKGLYIVNGKKVIVK